MRKNRRDNFLLILSIIILALLLSRVDLRLRKYCTNISPERTDKVLKAIEPGWDKTLWEQAHKLFIPKWREEILDQKRIIRKDKDVPDKVINAYLKIAQIYGKNGKYGRAEEVCTQILKDYPLHPLRKKVYLRLASVYEKEENFAEVRRINELFVREFPDDSEVVKAELDTIISYEKEGNYQKAIGGYQDFLEKYPKTKQRDYLCFKIALLYVRLGQLDKATEFYQNVTWSEGNIWAGIAGTELWLSTGKGTPKKKAAYAFKVNTPPRIDGRLTEPAWQETDKVIGFVDYKKNTLVSQQTIASLVYDQDNLYIALNCLEPNISGLVAKCGKHDKNVWGDDSIEVFLDTNRDYSTYFHLITNPLGTQYDSYKKDAAGWNPRWRVATAIGKKHWNVEIAIPFEELNISMPQPGEVWGLNLNRARRAGEIEISGWSFVDGSNHRPERFGYLVFRYCQK